MRLHLILLLLFFSFFILQEVKGTPWIQTEPLVGVEPIVGVAQNDEGLLVMAQCLISFIFL